MGAWQDFCRQILSIKNMLEIGDIRPTPKKHIFSGTHLSFLSFSNARAPKGPPLPCGCNLVMISFRSTVTKSQMTCMWALLSGTNLFKKETRATMSVVQWSCTGRQFCYRIFLRMPWTRSWCNFVPSVCIPRVQSGLTLQTIWKF